MNKKSSIKYCDVLFFLCVISTGTVLENMGRFVWFFLLIALTFLVLIMNPDRKYFRKKELNNFAFVFLVVLLIWGLVANLFRTDTTFYVFLLRFFVCFLVCCILRDRIMYVFRYTIYFICCLSLVGWFLSFIINPHALPVNAYFSCYSIFGVLNYAGYKEVWGRYIWRNMGLFTEPGILSVYAIIGLMLSFKLDKKQSVIFIITVLTTFSATGIILLGFFVLNYLAKKRKYFSIVLLCVPFVLISFFLLRSKMDANSTASGALRLADFFAGVFITFQNPIFGVGLPDDNYISYIANNYDRFKFGSYDLGLILKTYSEYFTFRGSSNAVIALFAKLGVFFSCAFFYMLYRQKVLKDNKLLVFVMLVTCLFSEPLAFTPVFLLLVASSLMVFRNGAIDG